MDDRHRSAIEANIKEFDARMAEEYDKKEAYQLLSIFNAKMLLEFDLSSTRKTVEESSPLLGDPEKKLNGFTCEEVLPNVKDYLKNFPNSVFRPGMKLMDFACGSGAVTEQLVPYLESSTGVKTEIYGVDVSPLFLAKYVERAQVINAKDNGVTMTSHLCDILDPKSEEVAKFEGSMDAIICTISYHHIEDYENVTKKLATFLKPGGWIFIVDFYNEDVENVLAESRDISEAVRHMGGLKIDSLNKTLSEHSGLVNVSSAREARVQLWQEQGFIESHMRQVEIDKFRNNELRTIVTKDGTTLYLVEVSLILAIGQKE